MKVYKITAIILLITVSVSIVINELDVKDYFANEKLIWPSVKSEGRRSPENKRLKSSHNKSENHSANERPTIEETKMIIDQVNLPEVNFEGLTLNEIITSINCTLSELGYESSKLRIVLGEMPIRTRQAEIKVPRMERVPLAYSIQSLIARTKLRTKIRPGRIILYVPSEEDGEYDDSNRDPLFDP